MDYINLYFSNIKDSERRNILLNNKNIKGGTSFIDDNTRLITYNNDEYPIYLKNIKDFPAFLFVRGKKINIKNSVGIVGTRKYTDEGIRICKKIIKELSEYEDITIVTGLANGIDTIAIKEAIKNKLDVIAVIPTNITQCYPQENKKLKEHLEKNHTVVTEIRHDQGLKKLNFVLRNRIIAGLSRAVFIPQTYKNGGSLITAKFAQMYDRDIFCTPSSIFDKSFEGCNELIMKNKAKLIMSASDIAYEYGWRRKIEKISGDS